MTTDLETRPAGRGLVQATRQPTLLGRVRSRSADDRGVTLVELMVTMIVTALVAAMTAALVIGVQRTNQENISRQDQVDAARVAVASMTKTLRAAVTPSQLAATCTGCTSPGFVEGSTAKVQFYSNLDNPKNTVGPSRVTYEVMTGTRAGELVETVQRPSSPNPGASGYAYCTGGAGCAATIKTRVLARGVQASKPVFTYFDAEGAKMTLPSNGKLSTDQLGRVLSVELTVAVQGKGSYKAEPTTYIQRVLLPNAQSLIKTGTE